MNADRFSESVSLAADFSVDRSALSGDVEPLVAILMATYNGERYLREQLDSIIGQHHQNWILVVSDDGSADNTRNLVEQYQARLGRARVCLLDGPRQGFASNFLSLCCEQAIEADYFAFCDQDDVWQPHHLKQALLQLSESPSNLPALYCGRTNLTDEQGVPYGSSPLFSKAACFRNALVQSIAGGNTMVFNAPARQLVQSAGRVNIVSHDWWLYMLISGAGGRVFYSPEATVNYRQHGGNLVGANTGLRNRLHRVKRMFDGHLKDWNELNLAALDQCWSMLSEPNQQTLQLLKDARHASLLRRINGLLRSRVYRQTFMGNVGLMGATLLKKL